MDKKLATVWDDFLKTRYQTIENNDLKAYFTNSIKKFNLVFSNDEHKEKTYENCLKLYSFLSYLELNSNDMAMAIEVAVCMAIIFPNTDTIKSYFNRYQAPENISINEKALTAVRGFRYIQPNTNTANKPYHVFYWQKMIEKNPDFTSSSNRQLCFRILPFAGGIESRELSIQETIKNNRYSKKKWQSLFNDFADLYYENMLLTKEAKSLFAKYYMPPNIAAQWIDLKSKNSDFFIPDIKPLALSSLGKQYEGYYFRKLKKDEPYSAIIGHLVGSCHRADHDLLIENTLVFQCNCSESAGCYVLCNEKNIPIAKVIAYRHDDNTDDKPMIFNKIFVNFFEQRRKKKWFFEKSFAYLTCVLSKKYSINKISLGIMVQEEDDISIGDIDENFRVCDMDSKCFYQESIDKRIVIFSNATFLHTAIKYKLEDIFLEDLKEEKTKELCLRKDQNQRTTLHIACLNKREEKLINFLINSGVDINAVDNSHKTALDYAIETDSIDTILVLLKKKADLFFVQNIENYQSPIEKYLLRDSGNIALLFQIIPEEELEKKLIDLFNKKTMLEKIKFFVRTKEKGFVAKCIALGEIIIEPNQNTPAHILLMYFRISEETEVNEKQLASLIFLLKNHSHLFQQKNNDNQTPFELLCKTNYELIFILQPKIVNALIECSGELSENAKILVNRYCSERSKDVFEGEENAAFNLLQTTFGDNNRSSSSFFPK